MTTDWRSRRRATTRRTIQEHALRLFAEKGYEQTTVEEIAAAAGVSHMTFFRHFPRKEVVVEYDDYDPMLVELIVGRPAHETPLEAVHGAIRCAFEQILAGDHDALLARTRLILRTPALQARNWYAQVDTRRLIADALARRAGATTADFAIEVQASAVLAAMLPALAAWADLDDANPAALVALVDAAFDALRAGV